MAILRDIMKHEDIQLVKAVKFDYCTSISQKLARDNVSDLLILELSVTSEFIVDCEVDEDSANGFDDIWVSVEG